MKRALLLLLTVVILTPRAVAESPAKWEYATLNVASYGWVWNSPAKKADAPGGYALYRQLGGTKATEGQFALPDVLNLFGQDGWELVAATGTDFYIFKRPSR